MNCPLCGELLISENHHGFTMYYCPKMVDVKDASLFKMVDVKDESLFKQSHYWVNCTLHRHIMIVLPYKIVSYLNPEYKKYSVIKKYFDEDVSYFYTVFDTEDIGDNVYIKPASEEKILNRVKTIMVFS